MDSSLPDYYATLSIPSTATSSEIKEAYKRQSLASHPDRYPNASPEQRRKYTSRFQSVADAYYVLSDQERRRDYDDARKNSGNMPASNDWFGPDGDFEKEQFSSAGFFNSFFGGGAGNKAGSESSTSGSQTSGTGTAQPQADNVFTDIFSDLLRPEVERVAPIWSWVGGASGAGLGFILGNIPGLIGGAVVGNRLGAIRDAKGKSVGQVFMNLGANQRAEVLKALAMKVLGAVG